MHFRRAKQQCTGVPEQQTIWEVHCVQHHETTKAGAGRVAHLEVAPLLSHERALGAVARDCVVDVGQLQLNQHLPAQAPQLSTARTWMFAHTPVHTSKRTMQLLWGSAPGVDTHNGETLEHCEHAGGASSNPTVHTGGGRPETVLLQEGNTSMQAHSAGRAHLAGELAEGAGLVGPDLERLVRQGAGAVGDAAPASGQGPEPYRQRRERAQAELDRHLWPLCTYPLISAFAGMWVLLPV